MTNYHLKTNPTVNAIEVMPKRAISEKRKKRLALLTTIELQRIRSKRDWLKKHKE